MAHVAAAIQRSKPSPAFQVPRNICALLDKLGATKAIPRGTVLFRTGDLPKGVFLVLKGRAVLYVGDDSGTVTRIAGKRSLLGLPSTVGNRRYTLSAEALTDVEVCHIPAMEFRETLAGNPAIGLEVIRILSDEVNVLRQIAISKRDSHPIQEVTGR